jgi:hypothetical protein
VPRMFAPRGRDAVEPMRLRYLTLVVLCILFTACSSDAPSDSRVASQIAGQFNQEFGDGLVEIDRLRQSKAHRDGHGRYVADVEYEMRFTKGQDQVKRESGSAQAMELAVIFGDFHAGDRRHMANRVVFSKRGKEWVLIDSRRE